MTINLQASGDPSTRGWGPGWPHPQTGLWVPVTWSNGASPVGGVRRELSRLVELLGNATIKGARGNPGYALRPGQCWGAENRPVTGTTSVPSFHSWGAAIDVNAPENPYQANDGSIVHDIPAWVVALWAEYGFRNGITYTGAHVDPMHEEFMGTPADAYAMTAKAEAEFGTGAGVHPVPPPRPTVSLRHLIAAARTDPGAPQGHTTYPAEVRLVEHGLAADGYLAAGYAADGSFGSLTVAAWARWQRAFSNAHGLNWSAAACDGIPGLTSLTAFGARHGFAVTP